MSRLSMGDPGLAPDSVLAYIEDMLMELAQMAELNGEAALACAIRRAAGTTPVDAPRPEVLARNKTHDAA